MMKKMIAGLVVGLGLAAGAQAADGTITFNGEVTAQTCTINGNGSGAKDFTVTLPTVSASALASAGEVAGRTPFTIALSACTPNSGTVHTYFEPGPTVNAATGRLIVAAGGASNVELGLLNGDYTRIQLGAADAAQNSKSTALAAGAATLAYAVQYEATGVAGAGAANSSVMYSIVYQ
ncbi:fimbrial protein [Jeongeupia sp. USM3]|uniref:fimbrial protein n=1 Tax=Jeongeupia sp. USM3 TaxID=1906741 RepID=UPI00089DE02D|nr:fimbrial protein [Jeongeupia sp. USM3]AOY02134.1 fimbrial protein [Jeongeupia sp. USM3]